MDSKHDDRRREVGKMFFDVAKYLVTAGLVGNLLDDKISSKGSLIVGAAATVIAAGAFFIVPTKKGE